MFLCKEKVLMVYPQGTVPAELYLFWSTTGNKEHQTTLVPPGFQKLVNKSNNLLKYQRKPCVVFFSDQP